MHIAIWFLLFQKFFLSGLIFAELFKEQKFFEATLLLFFLIIFIFLFLVKLPFKIFLKRFIAALALGVITFLFSIIHYFSSFEKSLNHISNFEGQINGYGCVEREVDERFDKVKYVLEVKFINFNEKWIETSGKLLVNYAKYPLYKFKDCFYFSGILEKPEPFSGFQYQNYLSRYNIYALLQSPKFTYLDQKKSFNLCLFHYFGSIKFLSIDFNWSNLAKDTQFVSFYCHKFLNKDFLNELWLTFMEAILSFKNFVSLLINQSFLEPQASFLLGLLLGSRKGIPLELMDSFGVNGLTHIIAISGYNITLLIVLIGRIFSFLSFRLRFVLSVIAIFVFVLLVGASAAVVRAAIMGVIALITLQVGSSYLVLFSIILAGSIMAFINPQILTYDVGFQLSFLATLGLVLLVPLIEPYFKFFPQKFAIRESIVLTFAAQIFALPIIVANFGTLSLISPLSNLLVLPFLPLIMLFGFLAILFYPFKIVSLSLAFVTDFLLNCLVEMVNFLAKFPYAQVFWDYSPWHVYLLYYFLLLIFLFSKYKKRLSVLFGREV